MDSKLENMRHPSVEFMAKPFLVLSAGGFCGIVSIPLSAAAVTVFFAAPNGAFESATSVRDVLWILFAICAFAAIPAGLFGFLGGLLGGAWLALRTTHLHSRSRVVTEATVAGALVGAMFPAFHWAMRWSPNGSWFTAGAVLFCSCIGLLSACLFALCFGQKFVTPSSASTPAPE